MEWLIINLKEEVYKMTEITCSDKDWKSTTDEMLHQAKSSIDHLFGDGYAEKHPELISGFIISASNNYIGSRLEDMCNTIDNNLGKVNF